MSQIMPLSQVTPMSTDITIPQCKNATTKSQIIAKLIVPAPELMSHRLIPIKTVDQIEKFLPSLVDLYMRIFSEPPYNETFDRDALFVLFRHHAQHEAIVLLVEGETKGFLFLKNGDRHLENMSNKQQANKLQQRMGSDSIYLDELAIDSSLRGKGMGKLIMAYLFESASANQSIYLRTGRDNNEAVIKFYEKLGFVVQDDILESISNLRTDGSVSVDHRIYMIRQSTN